MDEPVFDALAEISIRADKTDSEDFIEKCLHYRYGYANDNLKKVYRYVLNDNESDDHDIYRGRESILCARPSLDADKVTYWSAMREWYYTEDALYNITDCLFAEYGKLKDNDCYRLDLMDFARQLLAEKSRKYLKRFADAYRANDRAAFDEYTKKFMELFDLDNRLMGTNPRTCLSTWVSRAEDYADEKEYRDIFRFNAKNLIALWAPKDGAEELRDYAYREWNGMLLHYKKRWELYIKELKNNFDSEPDIDWAEVDYAFVCDRETPAIDIGKDLGDVVIEILNKP